MPPDSDIDRMLQIERHAEAARRLTDRSQRDRHAGVCWSGLGPEPFRPRLPAAVAEAAAARLKAIHDWRTSPAGRLAAAMTLAERALECIRACIARGLDAEPARCARALADLQSAVDAGAAAALTGGACAMNSASRPPSTG